MSILTPQLYDAARAAIAARGFDADVQTRIALFLGTAKSVNAAILGTLLLQPRVTAAYPFLHGQHFRELEFATLLARVTRWSPNALLYAEGARHTGALQALWWQLQTPPGPALNPRAAYAALALGHALLARVRMAPVIPEGSDEMNPFVAALRRIEQDGGRMIQAQIVLLKEGPSPLPRAEREDIIAARQQAVDQAYAGFLAWLAASGGLA
jgi:hypothetical protein